MYSLVLLAIEFPVDPSLIVFQLSTAHEKRTVHAGIALPHLSSLACATPSYSPPFPPFPLPLPASSWPEAVDIAGINCHYRHELSILKAGALTHYECMAPLRGSTLGFADEA